jgi:hypothetical protein
MIERDDITRMAREAGGADITSHGWTSWVGTQSTDFLERFAALVVAQNRPWVGLTEKEIKSLPSWWPSYEDAPVLIKLVKDVEAKLKEKNIT